MSPPSKLPWIDRVTTHVGGVPTIKKIGVDAGISSLMVIGGYLTSDDGPLKDASPATKRLVNAAFAAWPIGRLEVPELMNTWKEREIPDFVMHGLTTAIAALGVSSNDRELMSSAAMLATLFAMAGHLEEGIVSKSEEGIAALEKSVPTMAKRMRMNTDGSHLIEDVTLENIAKDDLIVVKHGDTVPVDGLVHEIKIDGKLQKSGAVQMPKVLDGEGTHHSIEVGKPVPQGAIAAEGTHLLVKAGEARAHESTILRNVAYLREAEESPSRMQHGVKNAIGKIYVPIMLAACAGQFILAYTHDKKKQERHARRAEAEAQRKAHGMSHAEAPMPYAADSPAPYFADGTPPTGDRKEDKPTEEKGGAHSDAGTPKSKPHGKLHSLDVSLKRTAELAIKMAPCAIAASTLVLSFVKNGLAAKHGIIVREDAALDKARNITHILTDIRGTLTAGTSVFKKLHIWDEAKGALVHAEEALEHGLLSKIGKAQEASTHPISESFREVAKARKIPLDVLAGETTELKAGFGAIGEFHDGKIAVGSERLFSDHELHGGRHAVPSGLLDAAKAHGDVTYIRHVDQHGAAQWGIASFDDPLREGVKEAITQLRKSGKKVVLVTGMPKQSAETILAKLETPEIAHNPIELRADRVDLTRENALGKDEVVHEFTRKGNVLAAIGDAGNDAPFMKLVKEKGGVSFAIGNTGAGSTKEVASMVIEGVHQMPEIMSLSRRLTAAMWTNVGAAASWMSLLVGAHMFGHQMKTQHASVAHEAPTLLLTLGGMAQSLHLLKSVSSGRAA